MGADGGVSLTKVKDLRDGWSKFKQSLLNNAEWMISDECRNTIIENVAELPESLDDFSDNNIINLLKPFSSCDCPYLFEGIIITAHGDKVDGLMQLLDLSMPNSISIETWT